MFYYFGYGSNMNLTSLRVKGVNPVTSEKASLSGWQLLFNVRHWFRHEGGMGNIRPCDDPSCIVKGVVHLIEDHELATMDIVEAYGVGYDRIEVEVQTESGPRLATCYVGIPVHLDDSCLPTQRYLNILVKGAMGASIDPEYVERLRTHPIYVRDPYPPFEHPAGSHPEFDAQTLSEHPLYTAVAGAVFDMKGARWEHEYLFDLFGGKDASLFHLKRLDTSDGNETDADIREDRLSPAQRACLNAYLHEYNAEYRYVGRYRH